MKKLLFLLSIVAFIACGRQHEGFIINGTVQGAEGGHVHISDIKGNHIDSVLISDGKFVSQGKIEIPQSVFAVVTDAKGKYMFNQMFFLENVEMKMNIDATVKGGKYTYSGAPLQAEFEKLTQTIADSDPYKRMKSVENSLRKAYAQGDGNMVRELDVAYLNAKNDVLDKVLSLDGADRSQVAALYVYNFVRGMDLDTRIRIVAKFADDFKDSFYVSEMLSDIEKDKRVSVGMPAPDFKLKDLDGKEYTLASFKGKYVYMDFSASWCGWCKKEIPYIREAYHKFKNEDIVFVTINMDNERELWAKDVEAENIEWLCISNCEGMQSPLAKSYNLLGIPAVFILDKEGKIAMKNVRQADLMPALEDLLK